MAGLKNLSVFHHNGIYSFLRCRQLSTAQIFRMSQDTRNSSTTIDSSDLMSVLSDKNKRRCQAQLSVLKSSSIPRGRSDIKRKAAVLIPLGYVDCQPSVVFTLRSRELKRNGGQVSFPGGISHEEDSDSIETALRESYEEIGLNMDQVDVWGPMLPLPDRNGHMQVTPIIANVGNIDIEQFNVNYDEVECVFTRDLLSLCAADNFAQTTFNKQSDKVLSAYTLPVYLGGEYRIWGLTAIILHQTLTLLAPGQRSLPNGLSPLPTSLPPPANKSSDEDPDKTS